MAVVVPRALLALLLLSVSGLVAAQRDCYGAVVSQRDPQRAVGCQGQPLLPPRSHRCEAKLGWPWPTGGSPIYCLGLAVQCPACLQRRQHRRRHRRRFWQRGPL